jgi:hypothetical protein
MGEKKCRPFGVSRASRVSCHTHTHHPRESTSVCSRYIMQAVSSASGVGDGTRAVNRTSSTLIHSLRIGGEIERAHTRHKGACVSSREIRPPSGSQKTSVGIMVLIGLVGERMRFVCASLRFDGVWGSSFARNGVLWECRLWLLAPLQTHSCVECTRVVLFVSLRWSSSSEQVFEHESIMDTFVFLKRVSSKGNVLRIINNGYDWIPSLSLSNS